MNWCAKLRSAGLLFLTVTSLATVTAGAGALGDDWPQWRGPNRGAVWNETGILETFPAGGLAVRWRAAVGIGFSSPIVAGGRVFLTDSVLAKPAATERVHAFDEVTGKPIWTHSEAVKYPQAAFEPAFPRGPIATPIFADGKVYALGASEQLLCLDAAKGGVLWRRDFQKEYPASQLYSSSSPLIEDDLLIVMFGATPNASVVAIDKRTGKDVWKGLDGGETASSPIVIDAAGMRQLIIWTDHSIVALAPATGATLWQQRLTTTKDATVATPVYHGGRLLVSGLLLDVDQKKPGATILWPLSRAGGKRVLSDTSTGLFRGDYIYSARSFGEFVCLDAKTGKQIWETEQVTGHMSGASVHPTANGRSTLLYNDRGELIRAELTPQGYHELSRARVLQPVATFSGRKCAWAAPAFANRHIFARTNVELVCASLAAKP